MDIFLCTKCFTIKFNGTGSGKMISHILHSHCARITKERAILAKSVGTSRPVISVVVMNWTDDHRAFVIETLIKNNESVITTQRTFRTHFALGRHAPVPDRKIILSWVSNFRATGSALLRKSTARSRSIQTPENISDVRDAVERSPSR